MTNKQWKIVPVEATDDSQHAMGHVLRGATDIDPSAWVSGDEVRAAYAAAISAAPEPDDELVDRVVDAINHKHYSSIPELARIILTEIGRQTDD